MPPAAVLGVFDSIAHAFAHVAEDVATKIGPAMAPMFGVPAEAVVPLTKLTIKSLVGSPKAKARLVELQTHGATFGGRQLTGELLRPALQRINVAVHDHPHYGHLLAHAEAAKAKARPAPPA